MFAEVNLIGTGGGYGESLVINLGNNDWIIVDSCINPVSKEPLALEYLQERGVNLKESVKLIICTHWHNDHIKGLSKILNECINAKFCYTQVTDKAKFFRYLTFDSKKTVSDEETASTNEFLKCLEILKFRESQPIYAFQDRNLFSTDYGCSIYSLSPSDYILDQFNGELEKLLNDNFSVNRKHINKTPNNKSVVLLFMFKNHCALLGADLEVSQNKNEGWIHIVSNSTVLKPLKLSLFKIPHHGSENAYFEDLWNCHIEKNATSVLTPFNLSTRLPKPEMLQTYANHTNSLYMTSKVIAIPKAKPRDKSIERLLKNLNRKPFEVKFEKGIINNSISFHDSKATWKTTVFEAAFHVNPILK